MRTVDPVRHAERRQGILEAAGRCFVRDGFRGASISGICAEAGISPGHLYHYFPSKEAILAALAEARMEQVAAQFARIMAAPDVVEALLAAMDAARARHRRDGAGGHAVLFDLLAESVRNPALAQILRSHSATMRRLLADVIRQGQVHGTIDPGLPPEPTAGVLMSVIDGARTLPLRDPKLDAEASLGLLKTLITRFLAPPA
ncbi:MAG TPA: TetR/AcrR family transcriptional regulator [Roseomonas sp.]